MSKYVCSTQSSAGGRSLGDTVYPEVILEHLALSCPRKRHGQKWNPDFLFANPELGAPFHAVHGGLLIRLPSPSICGTGKGSGLSSTYLINRAKCLLGTTSHCLLCLQAITAGAWLFAGANFAWVQFLLTQAL